MVPIPKTLMFLYFMNEKFNKNAKVEKFTNMLGIAVCLIVIDPFIHCNIGRKVAICMACSRLLLISEKETLGLYYFKRYRIFLRVRVRGHYWRYITYIFPCL